MLFDEIERTETRTKDNNEPTFPYLNASARAPIAAGRGMLELWFASYPDSGKADLRSRFRSRIESQHKAAFWELYLHELVSRLGFTLEPHPDIEGSSNHPDFLVKVGDEAKFYLEGTVAGLPSSEDAGAEARLAEVLDLVNKMPIEEWLLQVEYRGLPETPPPVRELRKHLEAWLASLNIKAVGEALKSEDWESLPTLEWAHDGLTLRLTPSPRTQAKGPEMRPIGVVMGEGQFLVIHEDIKRAIKPKTKKYGTLALPLVVAVNVIGDHCSNIDIYNSLFGTEQSVYSLNPDGSMGPERVERRPDGVWFGPKGPRNPAVSAVLVGKDVYIYNCADNNKTPLLVHNPYPTHHFAIQYPLPELIADIGTGTMTRKDGNRASEFLRVPNPWPPVHD